MSHAETRAAPIRAAAIAITPLPVHKSTTLRPSAPDARPIALTSSCESVFGAYTLGGAKMRRRG
jgi:hypothetical protein